MSKLFIAIDQGFYGGQRVRTGQKFRAADDFKAKWANPLPTENTQAKPQGNKSQGNKPQGNKSSGGQDLA